MVVHWCFLFSERIKFINYQRKTLKVLFFVDFATVREKWGLRLERIKTIKIKVDL
jgi:hypothetical protein